MRGNVLQFKVPATSSSMLEEVLGANPGPVYDKFKELNNFRGFVSFFEVKLS